MKNLNSKFKVTMIKIISQLKIIMIIRKQVSCPTMRQSVRFLFLGLIAKSLGDKKDSLRLIIFMYGDNIKQASKIRKITLIQ